MKVLIDGDVLLYRNLFAAEHKNYLIEHNGIKEFASKKELNEYTKANNCAEATVWQDHQVEPLQFALSNIRNSLDSIRSKLKTTEETIFLSGGNNFRYRIATVRPYKIDRDPAHKPVYLQEGREWLCSKYGATITDGIEADDALGIEACVDPQNSTIVTNDKDLKQISCWHYNWTKAEAPVYISPKQAKMWFYSQLLTGDATDSIPGVEGIGPVTASKILEKIKTPQEAEAIILKKYREVYGKFGDYRFLECGRLVYILRQKEDKNKLWYPQYVKLDLVTPENTAIPAKTG